MNSSWFLLGNFAALVAARSSSAQAPDYALNAWKLNDAVGDTVGDVIVMFLKTMIYFVLIGATKYWCQRQNTRFVQGQGSCATKVKVTKETTPLQELFRSAESDDVQRIKAIPGFSKLWGCADAWGCTPLHVAAQNNSQKVMSWLLSNDVCIHARDSSGESALHIAARNGFVEVCEHLVAHGAHIDAENDDGASALQLAALAGHGNVCSLLRSRGARVEVMDGLPLHIQRLMRLTE